SKVGRLLEADAAIVRHDEGMTAVMLCLPLQHRRQCAFARRKRNQEFFGAHRFFRLAFFVLPTALLLAAYLLVSATRRAAVPFEEDTKARTRRGLPLPSLIFSGGAMTTAPVGGSRSRLVRHCSPNRPLPCM